MVLQNSQKYEGICAPMMLDNICRISSLNGRDLYCFAYYPDSEMPRRKQASRFGTNENLKCLPIFVSTSNVVFIACAKASLCNLLASGPVLVMSVPSTSANIKL